MKLKRFLIGSAAVLISSAAPAADLPIAEPVEYVRICDAFGIGYFYIPGTDTCLKLAGYVRAETHWVGGEVDNFYGVVSESDVNNWTTRVRGLVSWDARTQTDIGEIRTYVALEGQRGHANIRFVPPFPAGVIDADPQAEVFRLSAAFIEVSNSGGIFTAGRRGSFFDFWGGHGYGTRFNIDDSTVDTTLFAWTFAPGNGFSFTLSAEDPDSSTRFGRRKNGDDDYEGLEAPDGVANIRLDQGWGSAQLMGAVRHIHDLGGDGIGFAAGAGVSIGIPGGWRIDSQGGYSEGAIGYVTEDPGRLGDFDGPTGDDQNTAWEVRAGIIGPLFNPNLTVWLDGSFVSVEGDDGDEYESWAVKTGARWEPVPGLGMGPEFVYVNLDANEVANPGFNLEQDDYEVWGAMWRIQRNF
jgi:hypothetical protein